MSATDVTSRRRILELDSSRPWAASRLGAGVATAGIIWSLVAANVLVIIWLWIQGGNVAGVHSSGDLLTSIGRLTGLLGAYFALVQVLMLARLPFLERLAGFDRLTVWHRINGKICLYLILAHVIFITIGYALNDRISVPHEVVVLLTNYPGMVTATIGTGLFILVAYSSIVIVRRHLRYEVWHLVHLTAYAAIALAWFHQIPTGNELVTNAAATAYWQFLYLAALVILVVFRFVQPIVHAFWYRLRVSEVTHEGPGVVSLHITGRRLDRLGARAGQFFIWRFLTLNRWWEAHPFSLSAAPDGRSLRITVKELGDFTSRMGEIRPGTAVIAEGPFGVFTDTARRHRRVALIAGGIGITPIRALLEEMTGDLVVVYRVVNDDDVIFRDELERLAAERGARLFFVIGDHRTPGNEHLMSAEHLSELISDIAGRDVYLCGPPVMMHLTEQNLRRAGVPGRYIHSERFAL